MWGEGLALWQDSETFKSMHIASPKVVNQSMDVFLTICSEHKINCMDYVELVQLTTLKHHPPLLF